MASKTKKIEVEGNIITIVDHQSEDFISLTDMMKAKDGSFFISDWLRNANTLDYISAWESMHNPNFNYGEFATIRMAQYQKEILDKQDFLKSIKKISDDVYLYDDQKDDW